MTIQELIQEINEAPYLSDTQKKEWIARLPKMNIHQLRQVAYILLWVKEQKGKLKNEDEKIMTAVTRMFAEMNKHTVKIAKKAAIKNAEKIIAKEELASQENLLKQLDDAS